jgi:hypothetical protein
MERFRWWLGSIRDAIEGSSDAKIVGALVLIALLAGGGYLAADKISLAGAGTDPGASTHLVRRVTTVREPVKVRVHGHTVVRWRLRRKVVEAQPQTVMQRETVMTPGGKKIVTRPVVRYRVAYRKKIVQKDGKTSTVVESQTVTDSRTSTVSRTETVVQTVTRPVTVVQTQTVVTTVTLPGTTVTVTLPTIPG